MPVIVFTSSDAFMDGEPRAYERAEVEVYEYVEGTYAALRTGPDGDEIARLLDDGGGWELLDGRRFSDWAVKLDAEAPRPAPEDIIRERIGEGVDPLEGSDL
jgi:hypothetical protein